MKRRTLAGLAILTLLALLAACSDRAPVQPGAGNTAIPMITLAPQGSPEPGGIASQTAENGLPPFPPTPQPGLTVPVYTSQLLDASVITAQQADLGSVTGLVLDSGSGQMRYVVVHGSPTPDAEKADYAIPWQAFRLVRLPDEDKPVLLFTQPAETLTGAPVLDPKFLSGGDPSFNPEEWNKQMIGYWSAHLPLPADASFEGVPLRLRGSMHYELVNPSGQKLGQVRDLILDTGGQVSYGVLVTSSFLNLRNRFTPLPWQTLRFDPVGQRFLIDVLAGTVQIAPSYSSSAGFPDITQPGWYKDAEFYWASIPSAPKTADLAPEVPSRALQVMGKLVLSPSGDSLGTLENLFFNPDGSLHYFVISTNRGLVPALPGDFSFNPESGTLVYQGDPVLLDQAPSFMDVSAFPQHPGGDWGQEVSAFWGEPAPQPDGEATAAPTSLPTPQPSAEPTLRATLQATARPGETPAASSAAPALASYVFNQSVYDQQGQPIGMLADLIFNSTGRNHFVVIDTGDRLVPVPWSLFNWDAGQQKLLFTGDLSTLDSAPGFASLNAVRPSVSGWDSLVTGFWRR